MNFLSFAQANGLRIRELVIGRISRCSTDSHPSSKNGAFFFEGDWGWVQDHANHTEIQLWKSETVVDQSSLNKRIAKSKADNAKKIERAHELAALKAAIILRDCTLVNHAYLANKGFPETLGLVDAEGRLLIPMRDCLTDELRGVQAIVWHTEERKFSKKMQHGMKAKGAAIRIGVKRATETFLVEGYATALSVHAALSQLHLRASVLCCFSDSNLVHVAGQISGKKFIFADNDESKAGEKAAIKTGLPYCMSDTVGHDANDDHIEYGILHVCKKLIALRRNGV